MIGSATPPHSIRNALPLVIAGFVISFVVVGGGIDTVGIFVNAIAKATDWSRSGLSLAVSIGAVSAALATPAVGISVDRYGVRAPMLVGVLLLAVGFGVLVTMNAAWQFVLANLFLGAGFAACALLPLTVAITVSVPDRTAFALGIVAAGSSIGALVLAPAAQGAVDALGWRGAYVALGAAVVLTPLPLVAFALPGGQLVAHADGRRGKRPDIRLVEELRRPGVAALAGLMVFTGLAGFSLSVHLVPYLTGLGHPSTTAAMALGAMIGISAIGKVAGGYVADHFGALRTMRLALILWCIALVLLHSARTPQVLSAFIILYGIALGTQIAVVPAIALSVLGAEHFGTLYGALQLAAMLASAVGPVLSGVLFDMTGHYAAAVLVWLLAMIGATGVAFVMQVAVPSLTCEP